MASKEELDKTYMQVALLYAGLSKAKRLKVGAAMVTASGIIIPGVNGLPKALGNDCEVWDEGLQSLVTKPEVQHAEEATLHKCAREGISSLGADLYITHAPCKHCAASMLAAGVKRVVYDLHYRDSAGLTLLEQAGIVVESLHIKEN